MDSHTRRMLWIGTCRSQNVIERAVVLGSTDMIVPEDLPDNFFERETAGASLPNYQEVLNKTNRELLEKAFTLAGGDLKQAAALLGLSPSYIYRLLHNLDLMHLLK